MELFHLHRTNMVQWIDPSSCQTKIPKKTRKFPIGSIYGKKQPSNQALEKVQMSQVVDWCTPTTSKMASRSERVGGWTNPFERYARQLGSIIAPALKNTKQILKPPCQEFEIWDGEVAVWKITAAFPKVFFGTLKVAEEISEESQGWLRMLPPLYT